MSAAPIVDHLLSKYLEAAPNPMEPLREDQGLAIFFYTISCTKERRPKRLAQLLCGHFVYTKATRRSACPRCGEMIRAGYDYDGFRNHEMTDEFLWPGDPLGEIHNRGSATK